MNLPHIDNGDPHLVADLSDSPSDQLDFARETLKEIARHECRLVHVSRSEIRGDVASGVIYVAQHEVHGDAFPSRYARFEPGSCPVCLAKQALEILDLVAMGAS